MCAPSTLQCSINKEEIAFETLRDFDLVVFGAPRKMFNAMEFKQLKQYIDQGGSVLVMLGEGGENK